MGSSRVVKRGDIWLVNLDPTIGFEVKKSRPAIIIQNDIGNKFSPITIIAPITSQNIDSLYPVEVFISSNDSKIKKSSKAMLNQIRAIDKQRLIKKQGVVSKSTMREVGKAIKISLGLVDL